MADPNHGSARATEEQPHTADVPSDRDSDGDTSTPRWVKVFGMIVILLVVLFVILHLTGNSLGGHLQ